MTTNNDAEKPKPRKNQTIIIIILLLAFVASTTFGVTTYLSLRDLQTNSEQKEKELSQTKTELESANKTIGDQEIAITDLDDENINLSSENHKLNSELNGLRGLLCDDQIDMVYGDILASSDRLAAYVNGLDYVKRTSYTLRNTLWDNALSKVHVINYYTNDNEYYSTQFLVYYDEFGFKPSTFWIDEQCWLDKP